MCHPEDPLTAHTVVRLTHSTSRPCHARESRPPMSAALRGPRGEEPRGAARRPREAGKSPTTTQLNGSRGPAQASGGCGPNPRIPKCHETLRSATAIFLNLENSRENSDINVCCLELLMFRVICFAAIDKTEHEISQQEDKLPIKSTCLPQTRCATNLRRFRKWSPTFSFIFSLIRQ